MKPVKLFEQFISEKTSGEIFNPKRGKIIKFNHKKHPELSGEFFDLISTAYAAIGGHAKIKSPEDVFADPDWNYWEGVDLHDTQDFDMIMFGKKTKYGVKYSGVGHDGSRDAKRKYISTRGKELNKLGYYIEVSGKIAAIGGRFLKTASNIIINQFFDRLAQEISPEHRKNNFWNLILKCLKVIK